MADIYSPGGFSPANQPSSLDDLLAAFGGPYGAGASVLSKIVSYLAGGGTRKRKKDIYNSLGQIAGQFGSQVGRLNPADLTARAQVGARPQIREFGRELDERYGFDQGRAGGEFTNRISDILARLYPQFAQTSANFDLDALARKAAVTQARGQYI